MKIKKVFLLGAILCFLIGCGKVIDGGDSANTTSSSSTIDIEIDSVVNDDINQESSDDESQEKYHKFHRNIKLYINPSVQYNNMYASNLGNEGEHMNAISLLLEKQLKNNTNIEVYTNNSMPGKSLYDSIKDSNFIESDYHLALHSNAGGGKGSEGYYSNTSYEFTKSIIESLQNVLPYPTRGLKNGHGKLYEINMTKAKSSLIEILFHDDPLQAMFIIDNYIPIANAIYEGIINYFYTFE